MHSLINVARNVIPTSRPPKRKPCARFAAAPCFDADACHADGSCCLPRSACAKRRTPHSLRVLRAGGVSPTRAIPPEAGWRDTLLQAVPRQGNSEQIRGQIRGPANRIAIAALPCGSSADYAACAAAFADTRELSRVARRARGQNFAHNVISSRPRIAAPAAAIQES